MIIPVILSGGSGNRLWPLSRNSSPKQFHTLFGNSTLFEQTLARCNSPIFDENIIVVGGLAHENFISNAVTDAGAAADIIIEPMLKNTAPAIAAACFQAMNRSKDAMVLVMACDHYIPDTKMFHESVAKAVPIANEGKLVAFGVKPTQPTESYGYILPGTQIGDLNQIDHYVEKPNANAAMELFNNGYLWNTGNFLFKADSLLNELRKYQKEIFNCVQLAFEKASIDQNLNQHRTIHLSQDAFELSPSLPIDKAVMELTKEAAVLPVDYTWSDVGTWSEFAKLNAQDENGNTSIGQNYLFDCSNNVLHSSAKSIVSIGVKDTLIVSTEDAVLVADKNHLHKLDAVVKTLKAKGFDIAQNTPKVFTAWGNYEVLINTPNYKVKRIVIKPGGVLSLQRHKHRSEHWTVVKGALNVTIDEETIMIKPNASVYVPKNTVHRIANEGLIEGEIIEVQIGQYLEEDDIERIEDQYGRSGKYQKNNLPMNTGSTTNNLG